MHLEDIAAGSALIGLDPTEVVSTTDDRTGLLQIFVRNSFSVRGSPAPNRIQGFLMRSVLFRSPIWLMRIDNGLVHHKAIRQICKNPDQGKRAGGVA